MTRHTEGQEDDQPRVDSAAGEGQGVVVASYLESRTCDWCGKTISYSGTGRPPRYCSKAHRNRASELRTIEARLGRQLAAGQLRTEPVREVVRERVVVHQRIPERQAAAVPSTPREWAATLDQLAAQLNAGQLPHYDHRHIFAALARVFDALEHAHPGGYQRPRQTPLIPTSSAGDPGISAECRDVVSGVSA